VFIMCSFREVCGCFDATGAARLRLRPPCGTVSASWGNSVSAVRRMRARVGRDTFEV
jgi:hypothetical protein